MRVPSASLGLALILGHATLCMADSTRTTLDVWPGKAARRGRHGRRGEGQDGNPAGRHDGDHQPDQRIEADAHGLPPGGREEHGRGGAGLPRRRLQRPRLGPRGGAGGPLAQLHRGHGRRAEVPRPAPGRDAQGHAAGPGPDGRPAGDQPGAEQGGRLGHRRQADRRAGVLGGRAPGGLGGDQLRQAGLRQGRRRRTMQAAAPISP